MWVAELSLTKDSARVEGLPKGYDPIPLLGQGVLLVFPHFFMRDRLMVYIISSSEVLRKHMTKIFMCEQLPYAIAYTTVCRPSFMNDLHAFLLHRAQTRYSQNIYAQ